MTVNLIYASTSGNVESTIEFLAKQLAYMGIEAQMRRSEITKIADIEKNHRFVFATSTWEHGKLNPFFAELYKSMRDSSFLGKEAAFIGLGDRRYEPVLFCKGIDLVRDLWLKNGGVEMVPTLKIQGEPYEQMSKTVTPWANLLIKLWLYKNDR